MAAENLYLNKTTKQIYEGLLSQCKNELRIKLLVAKEEKKEAWEIEAIEEETAEDRLYYLEDNFDALTRCMNFSEEWQTWGLVWATVCSTWCMRSSGPAASQCPTR